MKDKLRVYINKQELLCKFFVIILCITIMPILNIKGVLASKGKIQYTA